MTEIFEAVIALVAALITAFLVPYIKSRTTAQQQATIAGLVEVAVAAAEQLYESGQGEAKKSYVVTWLQAAGVEVDDTVDAMIEAAVYAINTAAITLVEGLTDEPDSY